jgi:hypothetical protein
MLPQQSRQLLGSYFPQLVIACYLGGEHRRTPIDDEET